MIPFITKYAPFFHELPESWNHLINLQMADTFQSPPTGSDVLLGADISSEIMIEGFKKGASGTPLAQRTIFGWILSGTIN